MSTYDPNAIGPAGWYHLCVFVLLLPWAAVRSKRRLAAVKAPPPRRKHYRSTIFVQLALFAFSWWVASSEWIELFPRVVPGWKDLSWGAVMLAIAIAAMLPRWRKNVEKRTRIVHLFMPRDGVERVLWIGVSACAGVAEEVSYRGVLYALVLRLVHQPVLAAAVCMLAFGVAHWVQGWKAALLILLFAGAFHALVALTGSLYVAMAVHFVYDVTAGFAYGYFGEKLGYPIEGVEESTAPAA